MFQVVEVFNKVAPNGVTFADHCHVPGTIRRSMGFRIAEMNEKGQRVRFLFSSMRPFTTYEEASAKLAAR